jgi:hypothetical protein
MQFEYHFLYLNIISSLKFKIFKGGGGTELCRFAIDLGFNKKLSVTSILLFCREKIVHVHVWYINIAEFISIDISKP